MKLDKLITKGNISIHPRLLCKCMIVVYIPAKETGGTIAMLLCRKEVIVLSLYSPCMELSPWGGSSPFFPTTTSLDGSIGQGEC